jgi:hypothetical protein
MRCCAGCVGDRGLQRNIIPSLSAEVGACSFCGTQGVLIVEPSRLVDYFHLLVSAYQPNAEGKLLVTLFREDWGLFRHERMDDPRAKELLAEILDDGEIVRETFVPIEAADSDRLGQWGKLRDELMYKNRFFPDAEIDFDRLQLLLSHLALSPDEVPSVWYRARLQAGDGTFQIGDMGAPPKRVASHGRANPAGIPYLYLGSTVGTAISEIRPHTGEVAWIAEFKTPDDLKLIDLRRPRFTVSPFLLADSTDIARLRADLPFLESLGEELTRPVLPHAAAIDYTPSQYLCEFIKKSGYDGVVYRSSVSEGINLALFDPISPASEAIARHRVTKVSVTAVALNDG